MKISVVIPTYNRPGLAIGLAKQIRKYEPGAEIIVVDQSDQKEDRETIKELSIVYLENAKVNTSIAKNVGLSKATGDIVMFFDDDVEITPSTLDAHVQEYEDESILGVAGRVMNDGEVVPTDTNVEVGKANRYLTDFTQNFWGTRKQLVQFPYGCNMSFRHSVLEKMKGFDEQIPPPGFEETDLGLRVTSAGKMIFAPDALVYHHKAKTGGNRMNQDWWYKNYYWTYGRLLARHVHFPDTIVSLLRLSVRIFREYPAAYPSFIRGFMSL